MTEKARPYEEVSLQTKLQQNMKWIIASVVALALVVGITVFAIQKQKSSTVNYTYQGLIRNNDPVVGKLDSNITLILFEDFACHVCAANQPDFDTTITNYKDKIRIAFKSVDILASGSDVISASAYAAGKQGKYQEYATQAFAKQVELRTRRETGMIDIAKGLNLDMDKWNEVRTSDTVAKNITTWNQNDVKNTEFNGGIERATTAATQSNTGSRVKKIDANSQQAGINATPTVAIMKDGKVVSWWDGQADAATIAKRIDLQLQ